MSTKYQLLGYGLFKDRMHAGELLAEKLRATFTHEQTQNLVVLALPRGGLPVAGPVCRTLHAPLDVVVCKKIGFPYNEEFGVGAVSSRGYTYVNDRIAKSYSLLITYDYIKKESVRLSAQCQEREKYYRGYDSPLFGIQGKDVVLVDDGIATGSTMRAAINDAKACGARSITVAVPVLAYNTLKDLEHNPDVTYVIYIDAPTNFGAVSRFYYDFTYTSDYEAQQVLDFYGKQHRAVLEGGTFENKAAASAASSSNAEKSYSIA